MAIHLKRIQKRLEAILDWLESAGWSPNWLERFVVWWRHFGLVQALAVLVPMTKFVLLPQLASMTAATVAEDYGWDLEVGDWGANLLDLRFTAYDVTVRTSQMYSQEEAFKADEISLDLSLWRRDSNSAAARPQGKENPVTKGLKGAGSGLKRLFGGGKKKKKP